MIRRACFPSAEILLATLFLALLPVFAHAADDTNISLTTEGLAPYVWTIVDVTDIAIKNHPLIKQAEADVAAAVARKGQAQSAWYPALNLQAGYNRARTWSYMYRRNVFTESETFRGSADWMMYDFGRTGSSVAIAEAMAGASREKAATTEHDVAFAAKVAFYNVLRAGNALEFQQRNLGHRETLLKQAQAFYTTGVRAKIDFVRAEANLYDSRASLGQAMNDLRVARIILLQRMGLDLSSEFVLRGGFEETAISGEMSDWIEEGLRNRPEFRALLEKEKAALEALRQARSGYYPYLRGNAGYSYAGKESPFIQGYDVSVTITQPLFSGFLTREQVKEAQALLSSVRHEIVEIKRLVRLEVEQSAYSVQEARERLIVRRKQQEAAAENLRLATARYEVGAGDIIEMTDAQTQMVSADIELNNSAFDLAVSQSSLLRAMGR